MKKPSTDSPSSVKPPKKLIIKFQLNNQKSCRDEDHSSPISLKPKKLIVKFPVKKNQPSLIKPRIIFKLGKKKQPSTHSPSLIIKPKIIFKLGKKKPSAEHQGDDDDAFENSHGSSWRRGPLLGIGGFGSVFLAHMINSTNTQMAVKSSLMENSCTLQLEKKVLEDLECCSNVVQCYGDEVTKSRKSGEQVYNILLEYCCGGSLHDRIVNFNPKKGLPEWSVRFLTRDIVRGIAYIHDTGYIHCDIKPENILLTTLNNNNNNNEDCNSTYLVAKIADFGLAMKMSSNNMDERYEVRGTESYMAPESFIDWPVDIWALGCVVLEMLTARRVWTYKKFDPHHLLTRSYHKLPTKFRSLSPMAIDFLSRCFIQSPYQRSSARLLLDHPFIHFY